MTEFCFIKIKIVIYLDKTAIKKTIYYFIFVLELRSSKLCKIK